jgi:hypothetical protein
MSNTVKEVHIFKGKVSYLLKRPNKFGKYSLNFYPPSAADRKAVKSTGIQNGVKEDDGARSGVEGWFSTFRSDTPFAVFNSDGSSFSDFVGNGSEVTLKLVVESFDTKDFGRKTRATVDSVVVDKLIEFVPETDAARVSKKEAVVEGSTEVPA